MQKVKKIFCGLYACFFAFLPGCAVEEPPDSRGDLGTLDVYVFDIGKADSIFITTENHTLLIDTGRNKDGDEIVDYIKEQGIEQLDYLVITHFDKDHVGGADQVIEELDVKEVIIPSYEKDSKQYGQFVKAMEEAALTPVILTQVMTFTLDAAELTLYPSGVVSQKGSSEEDAENDLSIVTSVSHGSKDFLFAGDAMERRMQELLNNRDIMALDYEFLKVPHHGRYHRNSETFIRAIQPKYAVITCSQDDPPDDRVLNALAEVGAELYLTTEGAVSAESDGETLTVTGNPIAEDDYGSAGSR